MSSEARPLAHRVALVTGGSRGIGRAAAQRLAADGASVAITYVRNDRAAREVVEIIEASGGRAHSYHAPIEDADAAGALVDRVRTDLGPIDLFVSNAGRASRGRTVSDTTMDEFTALMGVHVLGPVALVRAALPDLRAAGRGDVIVISSVLTTSAPAGAAPYTMAKSALEAFARTLAVEERAYGVRVNIVAPGLVATEMGERLVQGVTGRSLDDVGTAYPFGRTCRPEDVAAVVAFLASADASYLAGVRIAVDAGGATPAIVSG